MNNKSVFHNTSGFRINHVKENPLKIEQDKKSQGAMALKKGQQITGMVIHVGEQITLDFHGQEVMASKSVLQDVKPGDFRTFEVIKANNKEIELKVLNESLESLSRSFKALVVKNSDLDTILEHKKNHVKKAKQEEEYNEVKKKLNKIEALITEQDFKTLEEEGFWAEDFSPNGLYEALKRIKKQSNKEENPSSNQNQSIASTLEQRLNDYNLPATQENINSLAKSIELSSEIPVLNDKAMRYLISRQANPSAQNIYIANYSQSDLPQNKQQMISDEVYLQLKEQMSEVIKEAGYEVNQNTMRDAKWLLENDLPLTKETLSYKKNLERLKENYTPERTLDTILKGMQEGIAPKEVSLLRDIAGKENAQQLVETVHSISDQAIEKASGQGKEITIKHLKTIQEGLEGLRKGEREDENEVAPNNANQDEKILDIPNNKEYEEIKAKRQMEEIRLKMTVEAARQLEKKGLDVETQSLEKVVEELRRLEEHYHSQLLREAEVEPSTDAVRLLKETTDSLEELRRIPLAVIGSGLMARQLQTIPGLLSEGSKLQAEYTKAGEAYESLATVVNTEYGDSIQKAFSNAKTLLSQMGMEDTFHNQRAVRILGYNRMEITQENLTLVKHYDLQVSSLIQNLKPAVTVRMIKEGMNTLNMTIAELNKTIDTIKEEQGITSEDKYSVYLNKLEQQNQISSEERKAYIGIYRLLYNIEKSDGAALGAVIRSEREVTLNNLLGAIMTGKKGALDERINDEFGTLQEVTRKKESIASQLKAFQKEESNAKGSEAGESDTDLVKENLEFMDRILKQLKDELSPTALMEAGVKLNARKEEMASGIWDSIKDVPVEKLMEQLRQNQEIKVEQEQYSVRLKELRELCKTAEQSIRFLNDYNIPSSPANIRLVNQIFSNGESTIKKLLKLEKERNVENSESTIKNLDELSDKLIDKQTMSETYEQFETVAKSNLVRACSGEQIDSSRLAQLKSIGQQITFARKLAQREFYQIPIETETGITNINLTILRGGQDNGKVSVALYSRELGNIKAEFQLKEDLLRGFVIGDEKSGLARIQDNMQELHKATEEYQLQLGQIDFAILNKETELAGYSNSVSQETATKTSDQAERKLYRIAKGFIQTVRRAEISETDDSRAVS